MARMLSSFLNERLFISALKVSLQDGYLDDSRCKLLCHAIFLKFNFSTFTVVFGSIFILKC